MFGCKKIFYAASGAALLGVCLVGWSTFSSYARTGARMATEAAHDAVPVSFEIERMRTLITDLDEVMLEQRSKLIKQAVDIQYLEQDVNRIQERCSHLTNEVTSARNVLGVKRDVYLIGNKEYSYDKVASEATAKASSLQRARGIYEAKAETLSALKNAVAQAEAQIARAEQQREAYNLRLSQLEAQAENIAIRQELATSLDAIPTQFDAGAFQEVENNFTRLERELAVQQRMLDERTTAAPAVEQISFSETEQKDVLGILNQALGDEEPKTQTASSNSPFDHIALAE